jgi:hypothetical protein
MHAASLMAFSFILNYPSRLCPHKSREILIIAAKDFLQIEFCVMPV